MTTGLVEIIINSKNYGKLNGTKIFVTESLYHSLESQKTRNGESLSKLLETGRAVPGLKHLLFTILDSNEKAKIVFTEDPTSQDKANNTYFVNYNEFKKRSRIGFFPLYKEMGLNTARGFLSDSFRQRFL